MGKLLDWWVRVGLAAALPSWSAPQRPLPAHCSAPPLAAMTRRKPSLLSLLQRGVEAGGTAAGSTNTGRASWGGLTDLCPKPPHCTSAQLPRPLVVMQRGKREIMPGHEAKAARDDISPWFIFSPFTRWNLYIYRDQLTFLYHFPLHCVAQVLRHVVQALFAAATL